MGRPYAALILAMLAVSALAGAPARAEVPEGATWRQEWFPSQDGTMLRADVMLPADRSRRERHPVILSIGPYFGRNSLNGGSAGPIMRFRDLIEDGKIFERGYAYIQVDSRGYGGSDGCNDFGGPGEQSDVEAAVNWAAGRPWSNGRVGMWGKSYDGWTQVMGLAENPVGLKAAVIQAPLIETYRVAFMNGVHYSQGWYGTPALYALYDLAPSTAGDRAPEEVLYPAKGTATNPHCYAENLAFTTQPDRSLPYWQRRNIVAEAGRSEVPVLWSHGFNDINTKPDNFLPVYAKLRGPKRAWIGQWDHARGNESRRVGRDGFMREAMHWFDRYLKGEDAPRYPAVEVQTGQGWWRSESKWPPRDARRTSLTVRPGTYVDRLIAPQDRFGNAEYWTFTQRAPYAMHLAGEARFVARVTPQVPFSNIVVQLYDVDGNSARLITQGAYRIPDERSIKFSLYPQDWVLREGHRFGIRVTSDSSLFMPTPTGGTVSVSDARVSVPFLRFERERTLEGGKAPAMDRVDTFTVSSEQIAEDQRESEFPPRQYER